ncbi:Potassium uptake protein KtrB [Metamycoplasma auris 15026]|uniref:Potassium uptake protein KtrB n=1 Tax=Metamycoplasma auris 15026 TaxID=1188233 RepID=N9VCB9_9BACT|nr:potassium transporter TrkG [Metamycoplasma auris]ENY69328.1 Potassium uptake protein KtrB [Metamycoplasma auris 15026]
MQTKSSNAKKVNVILKFLRKIGTIRYIFIIYILFTILISLLLFWNITHKVDVASNHPKGIKYIDALFIATSAFSDTGLTTLTPSSTFNEFGQFLIAISMVVGGIGIFTIKLYIFQSIFGLRSNLFSNMVSQTERGSSTIFETRKMIKVAISFLIITTAIASMIFTMLLYFRKNDNFVTRPEDIKAFGQVYMPQNEIPYQNFSQALRLGIFHAISSINNAGFDLFGDKSLQPFYKDFAFQTVTIIVFIIGGVGFPVIYDIWRRIQLKKTNAVHRFQLFTKFTIITYIVTTLIGFCLTVLLEYTSKADNAFWRDADYGSSGDKIFAIFFQVSSTRSAGFSTVDYTHFSHSTILVHSILMFIGFSPVSTAGGVRNTTIAVIFLSILTMITGTRRINAFKRQIGKDILIRAVNVFAIASVLVTIFSIITYSTFEHPNQTNLTYVIFEACSAFGNTGLSSGVTSHQNLHIAGKLSLISLMIIGQFGIPQVIKFFGKEKTRSEHYQYIYEDVSIG